MVRSNIYCPENTKRIFKFFKYNGYHDFDILNIESYDSNMLLVEVKCKICDNYFDVFVPNQAKINKSTLLNYRIETKPI